MSRIDIIYADWPCTMEDLFNGCDAEEIRGLMIQLEAKAMMEASKLKTGADPKTMRCHWNWHEGDGVSLTVSAKQKTKGNKSK